VVLGFDLGKDFPVLVTDHTDENQITSPQSGLACVASPIISFLPLPHPSYQVPPQNVSRRPLGSDSG
ncbi:MAG TPA: hypothetical protein PK648_17210, partial [Verrucomicrobiales bacterium]|nr:hypothetical protein [Verrucomicrobiales bacterium]